MSLRKKLFGDRIASSPDADADADADADVLNTSPRCSELRDGWSAFDDGQYMSAIAAVRPYLGIVDRKVAREARRLVALAEFRQGNYAEAMVLFQDLAAVSADAADWFNVITSATLADEFSTAEHALLIAIQCQKAAGHRQQPTVHYIRYYFGCALCDRGQFDKAFRQLEELRVVYEQFVNTDRDFLQANGMPPMSQCLQLASGVLMGLRETLDVKSWVDGFASHLDKDGQRQLADLGKQFDEPL